jgi:hypothetical protein
MILLLVNLKVFFIDAKQIKNSIIESIQKCKIIEENISEGKLQKKIYSLSRKMQSHPLKNLKQIKRK